MRGSERIKFGRSNMGERREAIFPRSPQGIGYTVVAQGKVGNSREDYKMRASHFPWSVCKGDSAVDSMMLPFQQVTDGLSCVVLAAQVVEEM